MISDQRGLAVVVLVLAFVTAIPARADVSVSGDVDPNDPNTWTSRTDVFVGVYSGGTLNITNGSTISTDDASIGYQSGSTGVATVDGAGSTWTTSRGVIYVGRDGDGALHVSDGGVVNSGNSDVASGTGSTGVATVDGAGSTWTVSYGLRVGRSGDGTLNITGGGTVNVGPVTSIGSETGSTGEVTVEGATSVWALGWDLYVGESGSGTAYVTGGGSVVTGNRTFIADGTGSTGTVTIEGSGSTWTTGYCYVGNAGNGTLSITNGGTVSTGSFARIGAEPGSAGEATVDGAGSTWTTGYFYVGDYGSGALNITSGGTVSNYRSFIGAQFGSTGVATVDGSGSTWANSRYLYVGSLGNGTLNITNGGTVDVQDRIWVAAGPGSEGEIHFDGGTLNTGAVLAGASQLTGIGTINTHGLVSDVDMVFDSTDDLVQTITLDSQPGQNVMINLDVDGQERLGAGYAGSGSLAISNGVEVVSFKSGILGYQSGSTGVATVDGAGSTWTIRRSYNYDDSYNDFYVGVRGSGALYITGGGTVDNEEHAHIGSETGSTGEVTVEGPGSTWANEFELYVGREGSGSLRIAGGGLVSSRDGHIGHYAGSTGEVTVDGTGSTWTNSRDLFVGRDSNGTLNVTHGGLVSVAGELTIDYDGYGDGYINMSGGGMLALYGDANDSLAGLLDLIAGTDAIRYWDVSILDWADITGATYSEDYWLSYLTVGDLGGYTLLTVGVAGDPVVLGDITGDSYVDDKDLSLILATWHAYGTPYDIAGDDDYIDDKDLSIILANWHAGTPPPAGAPVPEPASAIVLLLGFAAMIRRRRG